VKFKIRIHVFSRTVTEIWFLLILELSVSIKDLAGFLYSQFCCDMKICIIPIIFMTSVVKKTTYFFKALMIKIVYECVLTLGIFATLLSLKSTVTTEEF